MTYFKHYFESLYFIIKPIQFVNIRRKKHLEKPFVDPVYTEIPAVDVPVVNEFSTQDNLIIDMVTVEVNDKSEKTPLKCLDNIPILKKRSGRPPKAEKALLIEKENLPTYCTCNDIEYGKMVACDHPKCSIVWFHFKCVNLQTNPGGKWYCPNCQTNRH